jgi:predicted neutral ceramidase superfamily lipid hydrolase
VTAPGARRRRDGFSVAPEELVVRATAVDGLADRLHKAASGPLLVDDGTFGVLGTVFGSAATQATALGSTAVDDLGLLTTVVADKLRDCHDAYAEAEQSATERFVRVGTHCGMWSS